MDRKQKRSPSPKGSKKRSRATSPATPARSAASTSSATPPPPLLSPQTPSTSSAPPPQISPQFAQLPQIEEYRPLPQYGPFLPEGFRFPPPVNAAQMYRPPRPLHIPIVEGDPTVTTFNTLGNRLHREMYPPKLPQQKGSGSPSGSSNLGSSSGNLAAGPDALNLNIIEDMDECRRFVAARGYEIIKYLGGGASGLIFLVYYNNHPVEVGLLQKTWNVPAVNEHPPGHEEYQSISWGSRAVMKFIKPSNHQLAEREIRVMVKLKHPYVVRIIDAFLYLGGTYAIVMEYGPFGDLDTFAINVQKYKKENDFEEPKPGERFYEVEKDVFRDAWFEWRERVQKWRTEKEFFRPLSFQEAWQWAKQITLAVHYVNHQQLRHSDVHHGNVFLFESEEPGQRMKLKLGDFGTTTFMNWGNPDTEGLMAPELFIIFTTIQEITVPGFSNVALERIVDLSRDNTPVTSLLINNFDFTPEQVAANRTGKLIYTRIPTNVMVRDSSGNFRLARSYVFGWGIQKERYVKFKGFPEEK